MDTKSFLTIINIKNLVLFRAGWCANDMDGNNSQVFIKTIRSPSDHPDNVAMNLDAQERAARREIEVRPASSLCPPPKKKYISFSILIIDVTIYSLNSLVLL